MLVLKLRLVQLNSPPTLCLFKCSLVSLILVLELRPGVYTCHCFRTRMRSLAKRYLPRWSRGLNPNFSLNSRKFDKSLPSVATAVSLFRLFPQRTSFLLCLPSMFHSVTRARSFIGSELSTPVPLWINCNIINQQHVRNILILSIIIWAIHTDINYTNIYI